jgi:hypothetical protein
VGLLALLGGCATQKAPPKLETITVPLPQNVEAEPPPPPPPLPQVEPPEPVAPILINASKGEDLWHLRSALNVAALLCDPRALPEVVANYNRLLRTHRALLTAAVETELGQFRAKDKRKWQALYDTHMTKVYNGYSVTRAREPFCAAASKIAGEAADLAADALTDRSTALLFRINRAAGVE